MITNPTLRNEAMNLEPERARTCNKAASNLFPTAAKVGDAFIEEVTDSLSHLPSLRLLDLNDDFWVATLNDAVFVPSENQFRQYDPQTGLYEPVQESTLVSQILTNLNYCGLNFPGYLKYETFRPLKTTARLKAVVERARDILAVDETFFKKRSPFLINCRNGVVNVVTHEFKEFSPDHPIREKLPVKFDPLAEPKMFLGGFLNEVLAKDDIDVLQQYCSQFLVGHNYAQKILVMTGEAGGGKGTLMKILGAVLDWSRVGIIREQLFRDDLEVAHFAHNHLLYAPDMNSQFLNRPESSLFKQLVGGDPIWADTEDNGRIVLEGNFPVVLACNAKPAIMLDQDVEAWSRRLVVLNFKKPGHERHLGRLADYLVEQELSGVLNWLLDGFAKLHKAGLELTLSQEQQDRTGLLLMGSESPQAFVRSRLVKQKDGVLGVVELYEKYQKWCKTHGLQPFGSKQFSRTVRAELETGLGLKYRHDLIGLNGKAGRGWKGLALVGVGAV